MAKKAKAKVDTKIAKEKPAQEKKKPEERPEAPRWIRMLRSLANTKMAYTVGKSYEVGRDVSPETAESWISVGAAEEDRVIVGVLEEK